MRVGDLISVSFAFHWQSAVISTFNGSAHHFFPPLVVQPTRPMLIKSPQQFCAAGLPANIIAVSKQGLAAKMVLSSKGFWRLKNVCKKRDLVQLNNSYTATVAITDFQVSLWQYPQYQLLLNTLVK
jgi:hypothetical protein